MSLFQPDPIPRYQEGLLRYLDTNFERVRQAFLNTRRNQVGPTTPLSGTTEGDQFWNTTTKTLFVWAGTTQGWQPVGGAMPQVFAGLIGGQSIPNNADTTINWAAPTRQISIGTNAPPITTFSTGGGWFMLNVGITIGFSGTGSRAIYLYRDGVVVRAQVFASVSGTWNWPLSIAYQFYVPFGSNSSFYVRVYQNSGASQGMVDAESKFSIHQIGGPGQ